jgi:hypothetical protein
MSCAENVVAGTSTPRVRVEPLPLESPDVAVQPVSASPTAAATAASLFHRNIFGPFQIQWSAIGPALRSEANTKTE